MKGVILAGGFGTRLRPLTLITNKHLLPVYNKPMLIYPLGTLQKAGLKEILVVCGKEHAGHFMNFLGSGKEYGVKLYYALQHGSGGIAEALSLAEDFADGEKVAVILGDNIFQDDFSRFTKAFEDKKGAMVFLKEVPDPERFGVAMVKDGKIIKIDEKPKKPASNLITTGFYLYDESVFDKIRKLAPSWRNELEITDLHNIYIADGTLGYGHVRGFWSDAGTFPSLLKACNWAARRSEARPVKTREVRNMPAKARAKA